MRLIRDTASRVGSHPVRISRAIGRDQNICPLTDGKSDMVSDIRFERNEIVRDHGQIVFINREAKNVLGTNIDQS